MITIPAKFAGKCVDCGFRFPAGTQIIWDPTKSTAKHFPKCPEPNYDGTEQAAIFHQWIERAQQTEEQA